MLLPTNISSAVQRLYDTYPFPPEPLLDSPPPGYNWRWNWLAAYNFCTGQKPQNPDIRILDAGCGTGVGTEYLVHLNPTASVVGIDLSASALAVARERCRRSGADRVEFHHLRRIAGLLHHEFDEEFFQFLPAKRGPFGGFGFLLRIRGAVGGWLRRQWLWSGNGRRNIHGFGNSNRSRGFLGSRNQG